MDNTLRYNEISMKASHNSYQRDETITEQITWNPEQNYNCGCGELELDISQSSDGKSWSVDHVGVYSKDLRQLSSYLVDLTAWSEENTGHDVITLYLDLKHTATDNFPDQLDEYILTYLQTDIYKPCDLMGNAPTLRQGAIDNGWPMLEELKGKFLVCLTGDSNDKQKYAETDARTRLCFADKDTPVDEIPEDENRVFFNFHIYHSERDKWMKTFDACKNRKDAIIRAYVANSEDNWNDCLNSSCHLIATDKISNYTWAEVGDSRFVKLKGLG